MLCKNCGNQIPEGSVICSVCGVKIASAEVEQNPLNEGMEGQTFPDATVTPTAADTPDAEPPKKFPKKLLYIGLPIVAVVLAVALCFNTVAGLFLKTFGSPASYLKYVEARSLGGYSETVTKLYSNGYETMEGEVGSNGEVVLEIGDTLTSMLEGYTNGMELSWLSQVKILVDADASSDKSSGTLTLVLGEQTILNIDYITDNKAGVVYFKCKELNDKYISFEIPDTSSDSGMALMSTAASTDVNSALDRLSELAKYLPTGEALDKLIQRYIGVVLDQITDDYVTKQSGEITADSVTEACTVLELKINEKLFYNIAKAVCTEAQNDGEIIAILERLQNGAKEIGGEGDTNIVEEYKSAVTQAVETLNEEIEMLDDSATSEDVYISLVDYVNGSHEIIGRELSLVRSSGETKLISVLSAENGNDMGYKIAITEQIVFVGKGVKSGDAVTGEYSLNINGQEYLTVGLENFNASNVENNEISGAVTLKLGSAASSLMDSSVYTTVSLFNPSIRLDMDFGSEKAYFSISVLTGETVLAKISSSGEKTSASVANIPAEGDTVSYTEIDPSQFDLTSIMDNLKKAGVPESLLSVLQSYIEG